MSQLFLTGTFIFLVNRFQSSNQFYGEYYSSNFHSTLLYIVASIKISDLPS
jgi:hypothetical protein